MSATDLSKYEIVIGLEVHAQLRTESKLFSPAPVTYGAEPNHSVEPVCLALPGVLVFQAGTAVRDGRLVTAGGRVISVVGRGATLEQAAQTAYEAADRIHFDGMQVRRDIGKVRR